MSELGEMGEEELVDRLTGLLGTRGDVLVGPGDDCAVVEGGEAGALVLKTDCVVEGIHYHPGTEGRRVGWKAVARVVSDFGAMGAEPEHFLVTLALRPDLEVEWVEDLYRGMEECASRFGGVVVGGETSSVPTGAPVVLSVAGAGRVKGGRWITRSGGRPGDVLCVTGRLGGSLAGKHLDFVPRIAEGQWLAAETPVRAMMDLSDGLARDLPRLAKASGCGFRLDRERLPCTEGVGVDGAIADGEDYELLVAVDAEAGEEWLGAWKEKFPDLEITAVGMLTEEEEGEVLRGGWEHF